MDMHWELLQTIYYFSSVIKCVGAWSVDCEVALEKARTMVYNASTIPAMSDKADNNERCVKCHSTDIHTAWHEDRYACPYPFRSRTLLNDPGEHLHKHCRGCGYEWTVKTEDAA